MLDMIIGNAALRYYFVSEEVKHLAGNLKVEGSSLPRGDALFLIEGNICSEFKSWKTQSLKTPLKTTKLR